MAGGLFDPLGMDPPRPGRTGARPSTPAVLAGVALAALAALVAVSWLRDDGDRGRPVAVAPIRRVEAPPKPPIPAAPPPAAVPPSAPAAVAAPPDGPPPVHADQDVEVQNGVRIVRPRRSVQQQGGETIPVPAPAAGR